MARVAAGALTWREGAAGRTAALTILARVKDEDGRVVKAGSERYELERKPDHDDSADVLFDREIELDPGVYSLEVAAYDENSARASVRLATMDVRSPPPRGPWLAPCSLCGRRHLSRALRECPEVSVQAIVSWSPTSGNPSMRGMI